MRRCGCGGEPKPGTVVFLGALEAREGLPDLLAAWTTISAARMRLGATDRRHRPVPPAGASRCRGRPSIDYVGRVGRTELRLTGQRRPCSCSPSRREGRWCEQIGLPISGVSPAADRAHAGHRPRPVCANAAVVLPDDFRPCSWRRRLPTCRSTPATPTPSWTAPTSTRIAEDWCTPRRPEGPEEWNRHCAPQRRSSPPSCTETAHEDQLWAPASEHLWRL